MREYGSNINLPSLDNLFSSEQERQDAKLEKIQILPLTELHPFRNHPFQVRDDDEMDKMVDSIKEYGVMTPAIVRPRKDGGYEIVAGHRRCHASQRAGVETIVVNSVSYADGKMFRNNFDTYYHGIRQVSDKLCRENRLSVIETDGKGKSYDEWLSGQAGKPTIRGMVRKDVEQAIAAADSFDGFITELQNMGYTVKYGPRVEHIAVRHKDAQRNIRIDRLDPRFSETALREYYRQLHRMPTEMQQEYRQENAPAKPKWQPTELQPTVRRARYLGKLPRRYPKVSGFMACYYHYCALLRKAYHGKSTKRCYFLLREDFLLFSRYQQQTKFLWENHIETMDELLAYKENAEVQIQQLARQRKVLYRQKREPERAAREEKIKSLTQQMKALRHEVYICSDIETDAAEVQEKLRQAELAAQEERNEVKQDEQRRRSSRSDGAGSLTGYRSSH